MFLGLPTWYWIAIIPTAIILRFIFKYSVFYKGPQQSDLGMEEIDLNQFNRDNIQNQELARRTGAKPIHQRILK